MGLEAADCFRWPLMGAVIHDMTHVDRVAGGNWMREREGALRQWATQQLALRAPGPRGGGCCELTLHSAGIVV